MDQKMLKEIWEDPQRRASYIRYWNRRNRIQSFINFISIAILLISFLMLLSIPFLNLS